MIDLVTRRQPADAPSRTLSWQDIPLELLVCTAAVLLAAGLELAGVMP